MIFISSPYLHYIHRKKSLKWPGVSRLLTASSFNPGFHHTRMIQYLGHKKQLIILHYAMPQGRIMKDFKMKWFSVLALTSMLPLQLSNL